MRKKRKQNVHGNAVQAKIVPVHVTKDDILNAECGNPNNCMIKVALKRALNLAHGYIHVDASGISISRNGSYREKAFMPRSAQSKMLAFDQCINLPPEKRLDVIKPFSFKVQFFKTSPVVKYSEEQVKRKVAGDKKSGNSLKKYNMRSRVIGIAVGGQKAA